MHWETARDRGPRDTAALLQAPLPRVVTTALFVGLLVAAVLVYRGHFRRYDLLGDDFYFADTARTWPSTWKTLAVPYTVHFCPLFRLLTGAAVSCASRPSELRVVFAILTIAVFCLTLTAAYVFLERETGRPLAGMLAVIVLGFSANLCDTIASYSSSSAQWSLVFLVLALLVARRFRLSGSVWVLLGAALLALLAPCWWTIGILAGPAAAMYLWATGVAAPGKRLLIAGVPLVGTLGYLVPVVALGFWSAAAGRLHLGQTVWHVVRATAEVLVLRNCGIALDPWSVEKCLVVLSGVAVAAVWWLRRGANRHLAWLGLGLLLMAYGMVYGYADAYGVDRGGHYQLAAQFGLVLFLGGGLKASDCPAGQLSRRDALLVIVGALLFWCTHRQAIALSLEAQRAPLQSMQLGQLELMAAEARRAGIGVDVLREAIGPFKIQGAPRGFDGLSFIEESLPAVTPSEVRPAPAEIRRRLAQLFELAD